MEGKNIFDQLWPALFEVADTVFPEFSFQSKHANGGRIWKSRVSLRADGSSGSEAGKAFISERAPFYISDLSAAHGRAIWFYIADREGLDNSGVFRYLCDMAGIKPEKELTPEQMQRAAEKQRAAELQETVNGFLLEQLQRNTTDAAQSAREYVKSRGYTLADLRLPEQDLTDAYADRERLEIGFLPSILAVRGHLEACKTADGNSRFTADEIGAFLQTIPSKAQQRVSLTLRERRHIAGFMFRAIGKEEPKYIALSGWEAGRHLTGFRRVKNGVCVLVEGYLDAMRAAAAGFENVGAIGGTSVSEQQIKKAIRAGADAFVLMLDNDKAGQDATRRAIETLYRFRETSGHNFRVYVATFPEGVKDFDELLRLPNGAEIAAQAIGKPHMAGTWLAQWFEHTKGPEIVEKVAAGDTSNPLLQGHLQKEIAAIFRILPTTEAKHFEETAAGEIAAAYFLDIAAIKSEAQTIREREAVRIYEQEAAKLAAQAGEKFKAGDAKEAETLLSKVKEARGKIGEAKAETILSGHTREDYISRLRNKADKLQTGYFVKRQGMKEPEQIEIPGGGISVVAASTGHGKTTFLINLLLEVCERHPDREFHFFSLEEAAEVQAAKALNRFCDLDLSVKNSATIEAWLTKGKADFIRHDARLEFSIREPNFWDLVGKRIFFHYIEEQTVESLCNAIRYLHKRRKVGGVFVDYFQLLNLENPGRLAKRFDELKAICLQVKDTAIETGLPLVFAAQFNQEVQTEEDLDIRRIGEAGDISRIAALVVGLWDRHQTKEVWIEERGKNVCKSKPEEKMFAKILKQRGGALGGDMAFTYNANRTKVYTNEPPKPEQPTPAPAVNNQPSTLTIF